MWERMRRAFAVRMSSKAARIAAISATISSPPPRRRAAPKPPPPGAAKATAEEPSRLRARSRQLPAKLCGDVADGGNVMDGRATQRACLPFVPCAAPCGPVAAVMRRAAGQSARCESAQLEADGGRASATEQKGRVVGESNSKQEGGMGVWGAVAAAVYVCVCVCGKSVTWRTSAMRITGEVGAGRESDRDRPG